MNDITLLDYFATHTPNESTELKCGSLGLLAQEKITGLKHPTEPDRNACYDNQINYQIADLEFHCAVNAAIRYKLAEAMIKQREVYKK